MTDTKEKRLKDAAKRALTEAEARKLAALDETQPLELGGPKVGTHPLW